MGSLGGVGGFVVGWGGGGVVLWLGGLVLVSWGALGVSGAWGSGFGLVYLCCPKSSTDNPARRSRF